MKNGFTVIELLVAVALTVGIGLLINRAFISTQKVSNKVSAELIMEIKARTIMDLLTRDFESSVECLDNDKLPVPPPPEPNPNLITRDITTTTAKFVTYLPTINKDYMSNETALSYLPTSPDNYFPVPIAYVAWTYDSTKAELVRGEVTDKSQAPYLWARELQNQVVNINGSAEIISSGDIYDFEFRTEPKSVPPAPPVTPTVVSIKFAISNAPPETRDVDDRDNDNDHNEYITSDSGGSGDKTGNPKRLTELYGYTWVSVNRVVTLPQLY